MIKVTERDVYTNKADETLRQNDPHESEGVSLKDMALSIWGYRRAIAVLTLAATILIGGIGAAIYLFQEKWYVTHLQFSLDFDGVEKNEYPNGTKFSTSDILVSPVINSVYDTNDLKRYLELAKFRSALSVIQTNDKIRLLEYEYAPKLDDKKLTLDQRSRLEAEFLEKKKNLMVPVFNLVLSGNRSILSIPPTLMVKVLQDMLSGWAEYADRVKGVNKFQIPLVSRNILSKEDLDAQDYLAAVDMIRTAITRAISDIAMLQHIPGSANFRLEQNNVSLQDLKFRMLDMQKFKISPLMGTIRLGGISKSYEITKVYLLNRINELKIKEEDAIARVKIYETSLNTFNQESGTTLPGGVNSGGVLQPRASASPSTANVPALIPQLGESFLGSIIKMAQENETTKFRQELTHSVIKEGLNKVEVVSDLKFYEGFLAELTKTDKRNDSVIIIPEIRSKIIATIEDVYGSLIRSLDEMNAIYVGVSKANLNPASTLFTVKEPAFMSEEKSLTLKKAIPYVVTIWVLVEGCILIGVLMFNFFRKKEGLF